VKLLQEVESPQERQRRWNAITAPAIRCLAHDKKPQLRHRRGAFAGVFTRLVAQGEVLGLRLDSQHLVAASQLSYGLRPEAPAEPLKHIVAILGKTLLPIKAQDFTEVQSFMALLAQASPDYR
jgi:hypothetical protein